MKNRKILRITRAAAFLALLLVAQAVLKVFGQYVLGSVVNLILITAVVLGGLFEGIAVSLLSPLLAFLFGFGPAIPQIIPIIIIGNIVLVFTWHLIVTNMKGSKLLPMLVATVSAAVIKFATLWFGIVKIAIPMFKLQNPQATVLSAAFSYPQLITAIIGGVVASLILPPLIRVVKKDSK